MSPETTARVAELAQTWRKRAETHRDEADLCTRRGLSGDAAENLADHYTERAEELEAALCASVPTP